ncbi:MAG: hypothetical protein IPO98_08120 [Saprospiraceae bacterium]|nr:hypothetical protein [Saprospiraceae bacterium]
MLWVVSAKTVKPGQFTKSDIYLPERYFLFDVKGGERSFANINQLKMIKLAVGPENRRAWLSTQPA